MNILTTARISPIAIAIITLVILNLLFAGFALNGDNNDFNEKVSGQPPEFPVLPLKSFRANETGNDTQTIEGEYFVDNKFWELDRNLFVEAGASLILNSTVILVNTGEVPRWIYVSPGSKLIMKDSMIDLDHNANTYSYTIMINGELGMENSTINNTGNSKIYSYQEWETKYSIILENAVGKINNSSLKYNTNIYVLNSSVTITNTFITNQSVGFTVINSSFVVDNSQFLNNNEDIYIIYSNDFNITNCTFDFYTYDTYHMLRFYSSVGILAWASTGTIQNCWIAGKYYGMEISDSTVEIKNCSYYFNYKALIVDNGVLSVESSNFEFPIETADNLYEYTGIITDYFALSAYNSIIQLANSTINNYNTGVTTTYSTISIWNSSITNSYIGLECGFGGLFGDNLDISNNDLGIGLAQSRSRLSSSKVSSNGIGIRLSDSEMVLIDNEIINNDRWGVIHEGYGWDLEFVGENFYSAAVDSSSTNGIGNLARTYQVKAEVYDLYNISILNARVKLENPCIETYNKNKDFFFDTKIRTDVNGKCTLGELIEFVMVDGYEKIYCEAYTINASYTLRNGFTVENKTTLSLDGNYQGETIKFILPLPNYSIDRSTFELSKDSVKRGDTLKISAVINYSGPDNAGLPPVKVSLFIDNKRITSVDLQELTTEKSTMEVEFTWKTESDVSYPYRVDQRRIAIKIEPEEEIEYRADVYEDDNYISAYVKIDRDTDPDDRWAFSSSSPLPLILFIRGIVAVLVIVFISFWWFVLRKPVKPKDGEGEGEEKDKAEIARKPGGPGRRMSGQPREPIRARGPRRPPDRLNRPGRPESRNPKSEFRNK